jgi:threonine dehydrogenase-like Zn-dependent dehydrogenase
MHIDQVPDPRIQAQTDVIARVTHAGICGSDLWSYRGIDHRAPGERMGHEWIGIVEEVGAEVHTLKKGDRVISPFLISDGTCAYCREGLPSSCVHGERWGGQSDGGQGEAVRVPYADGTLVVLPPAVEGDEHLLKALLPLTDVMATGHHAAITAGVAAGSTVAVIGDGAVGLCGVLAAKRLGAARIFIIGHQEQRLHLAQTFGATDVIKASDEQAAQAVREQTQGGADAVLECVGTLDAMNLALHMTRPGRAVSCVGFTHISQPPDLTYRLFQNITITGGVAPARAYLPELLQDVLAGKLDPSPVLDMTVDLDEVPAGYAAMDDRSALKVLVRL